jgi:hypothetical protein
VLEHKADVALANEQGWVPLHLAARAGAADKVERLLAAGASHAARNSQGNTPLHLVRLSERRACERGARVRACVRAGVAGAHAQQPTPRRRASKHASRETLRPS